MIGLAKRYSFGEFDMSEADNFCNMCCGVANVCVLFFIFLRKFDSHHLAAPASAIGAGCDKNKQQSKR